MVNNIFEFYRRLISNIKLTENQNQTLFDYFELDQIVEAAIAEQYPIVTAKKWAISNNNKGQVINGKGQDE